MKKDDLLVGGLAAVLVVSLVTNNANANAKGIDPQPVTQMVQVTTKESVLFKYKNVKTLTDKDLKDLLAAVGFSGKSLKMAWAVAKSETNGQPIRVNVNESTGDNSWGLFQINMIGDLGPDRRTKFELSSNAELLNPSELATVNEVGKMVQNQMITENLGRVTGSDTAQKLATLHKNGMLDWQIVDFLANKIPVVKSVSGPILTSLRNASAQQKNEIMARLLANPEAFAKALKE